MEKVSKSYIYCNCQNGNVNIHLNNDAYRIKFNKVEQSLIWLYWLFSVYSMSMLLTIIDYNFCNSLVVFSVHFRRLTMNNVSYFRPVCTTVHIPFESSLMMRLLVNWLTRLVLIINVRNVLTVHHIGKHLFLIEKKLKSGIKLTLDQKTT